MTEVTVAAALEPFGPATAIILTDEQVDALGGGNRAAVVVRIGHASARVRLAVMGGRNCIGLSKAVRAQLGVDIGDEVVATVTLDEAPREVEIPAELTDALGADAAASTAFEGLAYTHRKEFASWVGEAKRPETRQRRAAEAIQLLREGRTRT